jgi:hypothetical protein
MIVMSNFASIAAMTNRRREAATKKLKVVRIYTDGPTDKFGVWPDDGRPAFGRLPIATFDTEVEAKAFAFPKKPTA